jgi:ATP/maltotriose-dependent transcriptional regulator MalT
MPTSTPIDNEELLEKLTEEVADWEHSPYYLEDKELFDIERFLLDHNGSALKQELEETYVSPLNEKFWSASLAYQRLKQAREVVKGQDAEQERKQVEFSQSMEENKEARQRLLKDIKASQRRAQLKVIPGGKKDD